MTEETIVQIDLDVEEFQKNLTAGNGCILHKAYSLWLIGIIGKNIAHHL